jgi:type I restriction enzyme R subunit
MQLTPERKARQEIDRLLEAAGWIIQDPEEMYLAAGKGIAVREFMLKSGPVDYLLFVNRQVVGVLEAKKDSATLSGYELQARRYSDGLPDKLNAPRRPLPFLYLSTSKEIQFTNGFDPVPRSRRIFAFHKLETLERWMQQGERTMRWCFKYNYGELITRDLWRAQMQAITNLEASLGQGKDRALIQMATGSGKTFTAINYIYRMLKFGNVRRVLFLVDRNNLSRQTDAEFQNFTTPDDGRKFTEIYNVQRLTSNTVDESSNVVVTTIQRVYSMLRGEAELDPALEEESLFEHDPPPNSQPKEVAYNPALPIEFFDVIVVDECHRSIYNLWRQVLEYFDAFLIGMTATPSKQTFGFFKQNLVMEYTREQAVLDGVNVPGEVYLIRTRITREGSAIEARTVIPRRDRKTRAVRMEQLDEDFAYSGEQLDLQVVSEGQIRAIVRTYKEKLFTDIFPGRSIVPKTLIFAKDDSHAEDIVRIVREEFDEGNEFCQKITYKVDGKPEDLITAFRNSYYPRIAVTVDMIATGTDIKALEVLMFMRLVKSPILFEQMQGRGVRVIKHDDLQLVSSDAAEKTRFVIVDAVGAVDIPKVEITTLERKPSATFKDLLDDVAAGDLSDDTLITLANRIAGLERKLTTADREVLIRVGQGQTVAEIAHRLLEATDADQHLEAACAAYQTENPTPDQISATETALKQAAADLLTPALRNLLKTIHARDEIVIDDVSIDVIEQAGFDGDATDSARRVVTSFRQFLEDNRDEIAALQILYSLPYASQKLSWGEINALAERLQQQNLTPERVWTAYARIEPERVRMGATKRQLTDLIALVRHALHPEGELIPYVESVQTRYAAWLQGQIAAGRVFRAEQRAWLDAIAAHIGVNLTIDVDDLGTGEFFKRGGVNGAIRVFGDAATLTSLLHELNTALAA